MGDSAEQEYAISELQAHVEIGYGKLGDDV